MGSSTKLGSAFGLPMILVGVVYLLLGVLYFFPAFICIIFPTNESSP